MPMSRDERIERVQRLQTAHKTTKEAMESKLATWELHPGTDIARNWPVITAAYSGLEQTLKFLIAEQKGLTIAELIDLSAPPTGRLDERNAGRHPYRTHDLAWLFSKLDERTRDVVRDFYGRFRSLHSYVAVAVADEFLNQISGPRGVGYERWRYTLIEDRPLPRNSPETLAAIWGVCVQIAEERLWGNRRVRMPDRALTEQFCQSLEFVVAKVSIDRQESGEPFRDISGEIREWLWGPGHPLNAFATMLWHFARYGSHGVEHISEWLSDALTRWFHNLAANPAALARTSLRAFVDRAQGHAPDGASIRWNPDGKRFESVPWSLEARFCDAPPPRATVITDPAPQGIGLHTLWVAAREGGHRVLENRAFDVPPGEDVWFRTLEVGADKAGKVEPLLSIWRKRDDDPELYCMVEECAREDLSPPVRRWIDIAQELAVMRGGWRPHT